MKKDIEWLKEEASTILREVFNNHALDYVKYIEVKRQLERLFDQLDEPEVLSQEWIDEHEIHYNHWVGAVPVTDLQNLLVPKQEIIEEHGMSESEWAEVIDRYKWHLEQEGYEVISNGTIELTEQEIKDYDERYWPFAVKVKELEE